MHVINKSQKMSIINIISILCMIHPTFSGNLDTWILTHMPFFM